MAVGRMSFTSTTDLTRLGEEIRYAREVVNRALCQRLLEHGSCRTGSPTVTRSQLRQVNHDSPGWSNSPGEESAYSGERPHLRGGSSEPSGDDPFSRNGPTLTGEDTVPAKRKRKHKSVTFENSLEDTSFHYPTESKEPAKARKKAGHKPKKKQIPIEEHYDDLGEDLSGHRGSICRILLSGNL